MSLANQNVLFKLVRCKRFSCLLRSLAQRNPKRVLKGKGCYQGQVSRPSIDWPHCWHNYYIKRPNLDRLEMALLLLFHCSSNGKFSRIIEAARPKNLVKSLEQKLKGTIKGTNLGYFHGISGSQKDFLGKQLNSGMKKKNEMINSCFSTQLWKHGEWVTR